DLGVNLYTTLSRVLVEFVANAYDADATFAKIKMDSVAIDKARVILQNQFEIDKANKAKSPVPLSKRTLPPDIRIEVEDDGHGMSRSDLEEKFLIVGRRRREEENRVRSEGKRILMGRKGLGK